MAESFGLQLVQSGAITREALYQALHLQRDQGGLLGTCLLTLGLIRRGPLLQALARHMSIPPAPPSLVLNPDPRVAGLFESALLRRLRAVPYRRDEHGLFLAFADPRMLPSLRSLSPPHPEEQLHLRVAVEPDVAAGLFALLGESGEPDAPQAPELEGASARPPRVLTAESGAGLWPVDEGDKTRRDRTPLPAPQLPSPDPPPPAAGARERILERFRDEGEVAFAQATGFDRERTAVFRLDQLAAEERRRLQDEPALEPEVGGEEVLPAPAGAPRIATAAEGLFEATNEGVLARRLVAYYAAFFPRVLLLARHGDVLRGVLSHGLGLSGPEVAVLRVPSTAFAGCFDHGVGYYGSPPGGQALEPLYAAIKEPGLNALVVPVETRDPPAWLVYADHGRMQGRYDDVRELEMMAKEASIALDVLREQRG